MHDNTYEDAQRLAKTIQGLLMGVPQTVRVYRDTYDLDAQGMPRYHYDICTAESYENGVITLRDGKKIGVNSWDVCPTCNPY